MSACTRSMAGAASVERPEDVLDGLHVGVVRGPAGGGTEVNPGESGETEGGESEREEGEGFHFPELLYFLEYLEAGLVPPNAYKYGFYSNWECTARERPSGFELQVLFSRGSRGHPPAAFPAFSRRGCASFVSGARARAAAPRESLANVKLPPGWSKSHRCFQQPGRPARPYFFACCFQKSTTAGTRSQLAGEVRAIVFRRGCARSISRFVNSGGRTSRSRFGHLSKGARSG